MKKCHKVGRGGRPMLYDMGRQAKKPMETLDFATLELLNALEADLEVLDFYADELLDDEA
jgi:hypothetical protein